MLARFGRIQNFVKLGGPLTQTMTEVNLYVFFFEWYIYFNCELLGRDEIWRIYYRHFKEDLGMKCNYN